MPCCVLPCPVEQPCVWVSQTERPPVAKQHVQWDAYPTLPRLGRQNCVKMTLYSDNVRLPSATRMRYCRTRPGTAACASPAWAQAAPMATVNATTVLPSWAHVGDGDS